ncbi:MAG: hypothetical protein ACXAEN_21090 [Candidatus Thorarchaeota archaeon]|jgi:F0F1-type ATP synthase assembly protein I
MCDLWTRKRITDRERINPRIGMIRKKGMVVIAAGTVLAIIIIVLLFNETIDSLLGGGILLLDFCGMFVLVWMIGRETALRSK